MVCTEIWESQMSNTKKERKKINWTIDYKNKREKITLLPYHNSQFHQKNLLCLSALFKKDFELFSFKNCQRSS